MAVPEMMLGSFQMETSEGFDEFMYELGVNMFTRLVLGWGPECLCLYLLGILIERIYVQVGCQHDHQVC